LEISGRPSKAWRTNSTLRQTSGQYRFILSLPIIFVYGTAPPPSDLHDDGGIAGNGIFPLSDISDDAVIGSTSSSSFSSTLFLMLQLQYRHSDIDRISVNVRARSRRSPSRHLLTSAPRRPVPSQSPCRSFCRRPEYPLSNLLVKIGVNPFHGMFPSFGRIEVTRYFPG